MLKQLSLSCKVEKQLMKFERTAINLELPAKAGVESPLTKKPEPAALPALYGSTETQSQPGVKPVTREGQSPQQSPVPEKGDGNPAAQADAFGPPAATATEKAAAEKK